MEEEDATYATSRKAPAVAASITSAPKLWSSGWRRNGRLFSTTTSLTNLVADSQTAKHEEHSGISPVFQRLILIRERCPKDLVNVNKLADGRASFDFLLQETLRLQ